ncbi:MULTISPECIES: YciI family protein [unclassified Moraxella]|uniref:YciI family protein n=1 Tax=unclassified Moraxella TaxID=2685852 RepID=UPI003AF6171C
MALYVLVCHDVPNSLELRQQHRPAHLARLTVLDEQGRLKLGGFTPSSHDNGTPTGSVIIADFDSEQAVQDWVSQEPFLLNGVYSHVDIKPFVQVLPKV